MLNSRVAWFIALLCCVATVSKVQQAQAQRATNAQAGAIAPSPWSRSSASLTISRLGVADGARRRSSVAMSRSNLGLRSQAMAKAAALERLIPAQQWINSAR